MNDIDQKILNYLQANGRLSIKKLSEALFITAPAVSQRIKKLEENGYIKSYNANLDLTKIGLNIKAFIQLEVGPDRKPEFYKYIKAIPNVLECDCITGPYSMLLKTVFESTQDLDDLVTELHRFGSTNTQIVFSTPVQDRGYYIE
ncbi:Lrp/AsnC family transcriptional regulator [Companilactobacillus ginsenosidimutans]|uniref:AsnC family transcriptional regulator n=1 Tax=Companilactobacillus ginsenosidimutans TaxID=1007676 RepID=A0A0H4QIY4_9LACO|nr:Lrp/AsnC family transcriptional regulator [Companilactobacillus ginsenosidimutans]AKP66986.1 AsnC family transcriptional regulator [Companilactobacillus ginsenosidimutans]